MCNERVREKAEAVARLLKTENYSKANIILMQQLQTNVATYNIDIKKETHPLPLKREDVFLATHLSIYYSKNFEYFSTTGGVSGTVHYYNASLRVQQSEKILIKSLSLHDFYNKDVVFDTTNGEHYNFDINKIKKELLPYVLFSGVRSVDIVLEYLNASVFDALDRLYLNFEGIIYPSRADFLASI
jgi:hypothetical protein